jgi:hypothetical protein
MDRFFGGSPHLDWVNAFDLLKIYGAGWLAEPSIAYGKNPPFAPGGSIFNRITELEVFGIKDLHAAYLLLKLGQQIKFGRSADQFSRGQMRYLFFYMLSVLLKKCMQHAGTEVTSANLSNGIVKLYDLFPDLDSDAGRLPSVAVLDVIDDYLDKDNEDSLFKEPHYNEDLNSFLKWEKLGMGSEYTPNLNNLIAFTERDMRRSNGQHSVRDIVSRELTC